MSTFVFLYDSKNGGIAGHVWPIDIEIAVCSLATDCFIPTNYFVSVLIHFGSNLATYRQAKNKHFSELINLSDRKLLD